MSASNSLPNAPAGKFHFSPELVWKTLRHWTWLTLPMSIVLTGTVVGLVYWSHVPQYASSATLKIEANKQTILPGGTTDSRAFVANQVQLVRSDLVLEPLLSKPEIQAIPQIIESNDKLKTIASGLSVSGVGRSDFYKITYTGPDPVGATAIVNAVSESYLALWNRFEREKDSAVIQLLEQAKEARDKDVAALQEELRSYTREALNQDPFVKSGPITDQTPGKIASLQQRMTQMEVDIEIKEAHLEVLKAEIDAGAKATIAESDVEQLLAAQPAVQEIRRLIGQAQNNLSDIESRAVNPQSIPSYKDTQEKLGKLQEDLGSLMDKLRPAIRNGLQEDAEYQRTASLNFKQSELQQLKITFGALEEQYREEIKNVAEVNSKAALDMIFAQRELQRMEAVADKIGDRLLLIKANTGGLERVTLMTPAKVNNSAIEAVPVKKMLMFGGGVFVLPFFLALLWEMSLRRVSHSEEIEKDSTLPVVGEIASLPSRHRNAAGDQEAWLFEESIDSLRTGLVLSESLCDAAVFAVTSAGSQEGKTSVASQLAVSIARATGEMTLLIDGDMRAPDIQNVFHTELEPGLSEILEGANVADAIITNWSSNLHLLPAGRLRSSPHRLTGGGNFDSLIHTLRSMYRYIVIDTPPVLPASESLVMAQAADASLVCAMRNYSRLDQVRAVYRRLEGANANPIGVVLNGVPTKRYAYAYGKYAYAR